MFKDFKIEYPPNSLLIQSIIWDIIYSNCKGVIVYDFNNETYNIKSLFYNTLPVISINGSLGRKIKENLKDYKIDFYINQRWNNSVKSYNVIGQLNGTNPDETVIVGGLYDSWWCQGTADGAIGMSIAIGIAKYFYDNNIKPKCNVKFVAFGGEEAGGFRGATFHEFANRKENITTVIDINQVGFTQINPRITLTIITNNESLNNTLNKITSETDYERRIGNVTDFKTEFNKNGGPSNTNPFAISSKRSCNTILFVKDGGWTLHHRDGEKHTKGDVMEYFNWTDTSITSEMIWNVTKYFTVNPDSYFINCTFEEIDSVDNNNDLPNSINAKFYIKTSIPNDHITLNASLIKKKTGKNIVNEKINYSINSKGFKNIVTLKLPKHEKEGWYSCKLSLYNSTGRINDLLKIKENNFNETYSSPYFYLYPK